MQKSPAKKIVLPFFKLFRNRAYNKCIRSETGKKSLSDSGTYKKESNCMPRKKSEEEIKVMIPILFSWEIFDEQEMKDALNDSWKDKVRLILHQFVIRRQRAKDKDKAEADFETGWTKLSARFLESICSSYHEVLILLEKYGVIEVQRNHKGNKSCQYGKKSAKYRINPMLIFPAHITDGIKFFRKEPIKNTSIINAIKRNVKKQEKELKVSKWVYDTLKVNTQLLRMDTEKASSILFKLYNGGNGIYKGSQVDEYWLFDKMITVEGFEELDFYIECPYLRHHQRFSTTSKLIKPATYFEGYKDVVHGQSDVKSMQPYLLSALLFSKHFRESVKDLLHPFIYNQLESTLITDNLKQLFLINAQGKFWDDMVNALGKNKDEVKRSTLKLFYGKRIEKGTDEYHYNQTMFPDLMDFLRKTKAGKLSKELPRSLQRVEGFIFYNKICPRIIRETKAAGQIFPFTTVHDSIFYPLDAATTKDSERTQYIETVMVEEFLKLGVDQGPSIASESTVDMEKKIQN